jgi:hypothetical protein
MSALSNQERHALEDVFLSISSSKTSYLKHKIMYYHAYLILHLKANRRELRNHSGLLKKLKNAVKITFLQRKSQKT